MSVPGMSWSAWLDPRSKGGLAGGEAGGAGGSAGQGLAGYYQDLSFSLHAQREPQERSQQRRARPHFHLTNRA